MVAAAPAAGSVQGRTPGHAGKVVGAVDSMEQDGGTVVTEEYRQRTSMTPPDPILVALDAQVACYRRLAKLAEQQHELVQREQVEELLQLLTMRQSELDQLAAHERTLAPR